MHECVLYVCKCLFICTGAYTGCKVSVFEWTCVQLYVHVYFCVSWGVYVLKAFVLCVKMKLKRICSLGV